MIGSAKMKINIDIPLSGWHACECHSTNDCYKVKCDSCQRGDFLCPCCRTPMRLHSSRRASVRDFPIFDKPLLLDVEVRVCRCPACGKFHSIRPKEVHPTMGFTWRFMRLVTWTLKSCTEAMVAELFHLSRSSVHRISCALLGYIDSLCPVLLDGRTKLIIDEKHLGHRSGYITVVIDGDTGEVLFIAKGKSMESIEPFFKAMTKEQREAIQVVSIDRGNAYKKAVTKYLPNAAITFDPFHIISNAGEALNKVRREQWRLADEEHKANIKGSLYILLRGQENLDDEKRKRLDALLAINQPIAIAHMLKEQLRTIYRSANDEVEAAELLKLWLHDAAHCGLAPFRTLAKTMGKALPCLINFFKYRLSSGKIESLNSRIATLQYRMRGVADEYSLFLHLRYMTCPEFDALIPRKAC